MAKQTSKYEILEDWTGKCKGRKAASTDICLSVLLRSKSLEFYVPQSFSGKYVSVHRIKDGILVKETTDNVIGYKCSAGGKKTSFKVAYILLKGWLPEINELQVAPVHFAGKYDEEENCVVYDTRKEI